VAEASGTEHHWFGNDKADYWAKDTRACSGREGDEYAQKCVDKQKLLIALALTLAEQVAPCLQEVPKQKNLRDRPDASCKKPHRFPWTKGRWRCTRCGRSKKTSKGRVDHRTCVGETFFLQGIHVTLSLQGG
jgi:hypothetical protein